MKPFLTLLLLLNSYFAFAQENNEPFFEEIYFEDKDGAKIEGSVTRDTEFVYLVVKSRNAIGENAKLTMDEDEEYFYKKKFLAGGSSILFPITSDVQKFKFYIFDPSKKKHVKLRDKALQIQAAENAY